MGLDGFKSINDAMGHNTGDLVLQWVADRLQNGIRPSDMVSRMTPGESGVELARLGGDEFIAMIPSIKVDQSFVRGLPHDRDNHSIVRAILSMAQNLGFSVTAEGVETLEQAEDLKNMGCDLLQGYCFSKPVPAADIPGLLIRQWLIGELEPAAPIPPAVPG